MKKFVVFILFLGLLTLPSPAISGLLFYDDCESSVKVPLDNQDTTTWYKNSHGNVLNNRLGLSTEQARSGNASYKFVLGPYTAAGNWASDCELVLKGMTGQSNSANFTPGKVYWMGFSVFVPANQRWPETDVHPEGGGYEWVLLWQFHGSGNDCDISGINPVQSANLTQNATGYINGSSGYRHRISGDTRRCLTDRNYERQDVDIIPFTRGQWHDYVINFRFTANPSGGGFYKLWQDGTLVVNSTGINMYNLTSGLGPYFMFGAYGHMTSNLTVFFDEIRVGDANSSYNEVTPTGAAKQGSSNTLTAPTLSISEN